MTALLVILFWGAISLAFYSIRSRSKGPEKLPLWTYWLIITLIMIVLITTTILGGFSRN